MKKPGFLLLEMIISILISSFLLTAVLTIYNHINKYATRINHIITNDTQILTIKNRVSLDFQGICPLWFTQQDYEKIKNEKNKPKNANTAKPNDQTKAKEEETNITPINPNNICNNFLYSQNNGNNFEFATFITTNPLQSYPANQHRIVRVVYNLAKDLQNQNLFVLQRKEMTEYSNEFNKEAMLKNNFYTLANNVVSCKFEYGYISVSPEQQKESSQEWNLIWVNYWSNAKDMKKNTNHVPNLPEIVRITLQLQDPQTSQTTTHILSCQLLSNQESKFQSFATKRNQQSDTNQAVVTKQQLIESFKNRR